MTSTRTPEPVPRPRSPWSGSRHETWHRWQLDRVTSLAEVSQVLGSARGGADRRAPRRLVAGRTHEERSARGDPAVAAPARRGSTPCGLHDSAAGAALSTVAAAHRGRARGAGV